MTLNTVLVALLCATLLFIFWPGIAEAVTNLIDRLRRG